MGASERNERSTYILCNPAESQNVLKVTKDPQEFKGSRDLCGGGPGMVSWKGLDLKST